ncbi:hypothetical protein [Izhakiella australiensis]|nr:hypothetical protein [Izhakiella australiensis]
MSVIAKKSLSFSKEQHGNKINRRAVWIAMLSLCTIFWLVMISLYMAL